MVLVLLWMFMTLKRYLVPLIFKDAMLMAISRILVDGI